MHKCSRAVDTFLQIIYSDKRTDMSESNDYLLVKADVLPEVFVKVMEAKRLLNSGKAVSVNEAVKMVSLSRSAYYKRRTWSA